MDKENRVLKILTVDDNYADVRLIQEYFKDERMIPHSLNIVSNGFEALKYLERKDKYQNNPIPDIILIDLYMPAMNGDELLKIIRENDNYKNIVIGIMTGSIAETERLNLNNFPATFSILKPVDVDKFLELIDKAVSHLPKEYSKIL